MSETVVRVTGRIPLVRRVAERTRVTVVAGVVMPLPAVAALFAGTYVSGLVVYVWMVSGALAAVLSAVLGDSVTGSSMDAEGFDTRGSTEVSSGVHRPFGMVVATGYGLLSLVGLLVRYAVLA